VRTVSDSRVSLFRGVRRPESKTQQLATAELSSDVTAIAAMLAASNGMPSVCLKHQVKSVFSVMKRIRWTGGSAAGGANDRGGETALGPGFMPDEIVQRRDFEGASGGGLVFEVREVHQSQGRLSWTVTPKIPTALKRSVF
jgi:hypothetical protein